MAIYRFEDLFVYDNNNHTFTPRTTIRLGDVLLTPSVTFNENTQFNGIPLSQFNGKHIEADFINGIFIIRGFYIHETNKAY